MVPERRQRLRVVPPRCLSYPVERTLQGTPALCPDPGLLARLPLGQLPSLHGLRRVLSVLDAVTLFGRFVGTMELSDSLPPCITAVPLWVRRADLAAMGQARCRASRVPHTMFPCMPGVFDPAGCGATSP